MKKLLLALALAIPAMAMATGSPAPTPTPTPQVFDIDAQLAAQAAAKAQAQAAAAAAARSVSDANAENYAANDINLMTQHSSKTFVFPAPVWTMLPETRGCFVTESRAGAGGWNFISGSKSVQFSDPVCVSGRMSESARTMCQFATADLIDRNTYKMLWPNATLWATNPELRNLSLEQCEALKRPRLALTTQVTLPPAVIAPPPAAVVPPAPLAPPKRKPAAKKTVPCKAVTVERQICVPQK